MWSNLKTHWSFECIRVSNALKSSKDEVVAATENLQEHTAGDHVEQVKQQEPHGVMTDKPGLFGIIWAIISEHGVGELPWNSQVNESASYNPSSIFLPVL